MPEALLAGRVAIVTGAARGMGRDVALLLARQGADLALVGRKPGPLQAMAEAVAALGRRVLALPTDLTDEPAVIAMAAAAVGGLGPVDVLVNVAGVTGPPPLPIWDVDPAAFDETMAGNLTATFLPMRHVMPAMIARRAGVVVNIGGTFGHVGARNRAVYGASKWALRGLTRSAAREAGPFGVRVNLIAPGPVDGPRLSFQLDEQAGMTGRTAAEVLADFTTRAPLGRVSQGSDIANAVLFLASDLSANVTGQEVIVDGGILA